MERGRRRLLKKKNPKEEKVPAFAAKPAPFGAPQRQQRPKGRLQEDEGRPAARRPEPLGKRDPNTRRSRPPPRPAPAPHSPGGSGCGGASRQRPAPPPSPPHRPPRRGPQAVPPAAHHARRGAPPAGRLSGHGSRRCGPLASARLGWRALPPRLRSARLPERRARRARGSLGAVVVRGPRRGLGREPPGLPSFGPNAGSQPGARHYTSPGARTGALPQLTTGNGGEGPSVFLTGPREQAVPPGPSAAQCGGRAAPGAEAFLHRQSAARRVAPTSVPRPRKHAAFSPSVLKATTPPCWFDSSYKAVPFSLSTNWGSFYT